MSVSEREKQRVLDLHNEGFNLLSPAEMKNTDVLNPARREAPGPPRSDLVWSNTLSAEAEKWARQMARMNKFDHENQKLMGENLYETDDLAFRYSSAVREWIAEKDYYSGEDVGEKSKKKRNQMIGHYTQIICPEVTKVGMASARGRRYTYIVARYDYLQMRGTKPWGSATHLPQALKLDFKLWEKLHGRTIDILDMPYNYPELRNAIKNDTRNNIRDISPSCQEPTSARGSPHPFPHRGTETLC
ncbi:hypothetical protein IFR05_006365 [Cadophora sp. M221]|nr:hypothetical protein IFR05_006365 [Cadophora sp. M221]